ncbi:hypothetical protein HCN44_005330 [Aphidius gifuensis]|uniref:Uncharacterized protein n=1 Tax=Aphidius gifuensis TaxID=684658 RepID=A0A835CX32_APHGI|nr:hypothetical protein HCN44_005330 [Aphidius gifuensis]
MNSQVIFGWVILLVFIGIIGASEIKDDDNIDIFENKLTSQEATEKNEGQVSTTTISTIKKVDSFLTDNPTKQLDNALEQNEEMESKNTIKLDFVDDDDKSIEKEEKTNLCDDEENSDENLVEIIQINTQEDDEKTANEMKLFQMFEFKMDILVKQLLFLELESSKIEKISCGNRWRYLVNTIISTFGISQSSQLDVVYDGECMAEKESSLEYLNQMIEEKAKEIKALEFILENKN